MFAMEILKGAFTQNLWYHIYMIWVKHSFIIGSVRVNDGNEANISIHCSLGARTQNDWVPARRKINGCYYICAHFAKNVYLGKVCAQMYTMKTRGNEPAFSKNERKCAATNQ